MTLIVPGNKGSFYLCESIPQFRKTALIRALQIHESFVVESIEGNHEGKAGDWLAQGPAGELWVIDKTIFEETYEQA